VAEVAKAGGVAKGESYAERVWKAPEDADKPQEPRGQFTSVPTLVDRVIEELQEMVLAGRLKPGERLVEERLTEYLGVSRPPLREALRALQRDGLVLHSPRRGVIVAPLDAQDVREIYSLRWALERLAIDLSVPVEESQLGGLEEALREMRAAAEARDAEGVVLANWRFHVGLCALPGHRRLLRSYQGLTMQLRICMAMNLRFREQLYGDALESVGRHESLLARIREGDKQAIFSEIDHHGDMAFIDRLETLIGEES
jgi:DNA-binding GntR family transcriptional regulator